ncbi:hypothetical protein [Streptomyces omiyaensis]|uniref:hypothetical protein n=1 Tax=Streptomyces omiyaensis TaxID=68247 RepID=UPI0036F95D17
MAEQLTKWSVTAGTVVHHMHYGLRVQIPSGEIGVVDRVYIDDGYVNPADWPSISSVIAVVGAGYVGTQLRLSSRPTHIEEARARMVDNHHSTAHAAAEDFGPDCRVRSS